MTRPLKWLIEEALREDIGPGDLTTDSVVGPEARCRAHLRAKRAGVLSGIDAFRLTFDCLDAQIDGWQSLGDGDRFDVGTEVAVFEARTQAVLTGERTALNFVQHFSGIATMTAEFVALVEGFPAKIIDTRKTTPLLRQFEKRAVKHGGGFNHRFGLSQGVLVKENHIRAAGGVKAALAGIRASVPHLTPVEVEVQTFDEFDEALDAGVDAILLDNMCLADMRLAVQRAQGAPVTLEASGNVSRDTVRAIAETGVCLISVGALTHSAPAADLSLLIEYE